MSAPKVLADIVESLLGAVYVDTNKCYETVWKVCVYMCMLSFASEQVNAYQ